MRIIAAAILFASVATPVLAQAPRAQVKAPSDPVWEVSGGVSWAGGYDFGESAADLTRNTGGTGPFTQFVTDSKVDPPIGAQARIGYVVTRNLVIEGGFRYAKPRLEIELSGDTEEAPDTTADETLSQYIVDGAVVYQFAGSGRARAVPFITGGVGYLRELHEGDELVETGTIYHAGGGLKYWFSPGIGFRGEAGIVIRDGGFDFDEGARTLPTASASIVFRF